tara:strand:+ start:30 stop:200 length:171 start_codon:yes stop_codon:yes gene_type:complete
VWESVITAQRFAVAIKAGDGLWSVCRTGSLLKAGILSTWGEASYVSFGNGCKADNQ